MAAASPRSQPVQVVSSEAITKSSSFVHTWIESAYLLVRLPVQSLYDGNSGKQRPPKWRRISSRRYARYFAVSWTYDEMGEFVAGLIRGPWLLSTSPEHARRRCAHSAAPQAPLICSLVAGTGCTRSIVAATMLHSESTCPRARPLNPYRRGVLACTVSVASRAAAYVTASSCYLRYGPALAHCLNCRSSVL